jgi:hypothetical protein
VTVLLRGDHITFDPRLDRVPSFDPLSYGWPVRGLLAAEIGTAKPPLRSFTWQVGPVLDQGAEGACVGFGHAARIMALPDRHKEIDNTWAREVYKAAQKIDEWPGESYEGTSVLAGAKVLKTRGFYSEYRWAFGVEDAARAIGYLGPVVFGTVWLDGMSNPRPSGLLEVTGRVAGGHGWLGRGVRMRAVLPGEGLKPIEVVRARQSWGPDWGAGGDFFIRLDDLDRLLNQEGECCLPVEPRQRRRDLDSPADTGSSWP